MRPLARRQHDNARVFDANFFLERGQARAQTSILSSLLSTRASTVVEALLDLEQGSARKSHREQRRALDRLGPFEWQRDGER